MSIYVIGINHKTAPVALREKVYFALDKLSLYLQDLLSHDYTEDVVLLSTCNRSELYCATHHIDAVKQWFCNQSAVSYADIVAVMYEYKNEAAIAHIMEVACGLDSMILGEPQILGQMKEAFSESCSAGSVTALFHQLFQYVFAIAKEIRTTTAIGACPVSVASAAVSFAKQNVSSFDDANVVLIGAGDTIELLIRYLKNFIRKPFVLVNRNVEKGYTLQQKDLIDRVYGFDQLTDAIKNADIVFSATGSPTPVINKIMLAEMMKRRDVKPLMLIDIAVPRDIEHAVSELPHVNLFCIDDLKIMIEKNRQGREHAAQKARELIRQKSVKFMSEITSFYKVSHTIRAYRCQIEELCQIELEKARDQIKQGMDPLHVLDTFAYMFTKKLLHTPSVQLRQAGVEGRFEFLRFAKQLFAIPDTEAEQL